jgi:DNA-binding MarR family transcriptional regulator
MVPRREERRGRVSEQPVSPLEAHLGYWLRFVSNQVSHSFSVKLAAREVTVAEWVVLRELYECDPTVPSVLAEHIGMTRGGVSKLIDRLADKGLVKRIANETDRRYQALALTGRGRTLVPKLAVLADQNDAEFFAHLSAAERASIERAMREIVRRHGLKAMPVD